MFITKLKPLARRPRRLALPLAVAAAALASATWVTPALAGGCNWDQCYRPVNATEPTASVDGPTTLNPITYTATTTDGMWANSPTSYSYLWQQCDSSGSNCTWISLAGKTIQLSQAGVWIRSVVTASNWWGESKEAYSEPVMVPCGRCWG